MGYREGFKTGYESETNPFAVLLSGINESFARRRAEDKKRSDEERQLRDELVKLGAKAEYDKEMAREEGNIKAKQKRQEMFLESKLKSKEKEAELSKTGEILGRFGMGKGEGNTLENIAKNIPEGVSTEFGPFKITGKGMGQTAKNELDQARQQLFNMETMEKMLVGQPSGRLAGTAAKISGFLTGGEKKTEVTLYQQMKPAIAAGLYRNITGDKRLSDLDAAQRALPLVPDVSESQKLQKKKIENIKKLLKRRIDSLEQGKTGEFILDASGNLTEKTEIQSEWTPEKEARLQELRTKLNR